MVKVNQDRRSNTYLSFMKVINLVTMMGFISDKLDAQTFTPVEASPVTNERLESRGSCWGDFDNDGDLDLFVANSCYHLPIDSVHCLLSGNILYKNNGEGSFTSIGLFRTPDSVSNSASWGDFDNDRDLDLLVVNGFEDSRRAVDLPNFLYRNDSDGKFSLIVSSPIYTDGGNSTGCSFGDYDNDGDLDIFITNRRNQSNFLYRNDGNCQFTRINSEPFITDKGDSQGGSWADYDNDGDLDIFVANGSDQENFLYQNLGNGSFAKITNGPIVNDQAWSMSGSWGDYDNDADLDLFVANTRNQRNSLYRNEGKGSFSKITEGPVVDEPNWSNSGSWGDFDNDGDLDLYVSNGKGSSNGSLDDSFYENVGSGAFAKVNVGIIVSDGGDSHGVSCADFNNDGQLDIFVANGYQLQNTRRNNSLYLNNGTKNNWINLKCVGTTSNTSAIGAKVKVYTKIKGVSQWQMNEISGQTGTGGQNSLDAEFGLAEAERLDSIKIEWPSGRRTLLEKVQANHFFTIEETDIPPSPPQNLRAEVSKGSITLSWTPNTEFDFWEYRVYADTITNPTTKIASVAEASNTQKSFDDLIAGEVYYFRLTAVDRAFHESDFSVQINASLPQHFVRITIGDIVNDKAYSTGCSWADYNNDSYPDLFVATNRGFGDRPPGIRKNFLYTNNGDGSFSKIMAGPIVNDSSLSFGNTWGDYDNDGDLDLFVANSFFQPDFSRNFLYRNDGELGFVRIDTGAVATDEGFGVGSSWADYDNDGDLDLFVSNAGDPPIGNFLYKNRGNGYFVRVKSGSIVTDKNSSLGCSWGDYDNDGNLDLFVANWSVGNNALYKNNGNGTFTKIEDSPVASDEGLSSGGNWVDFDNDGDLDLYVVNSTLDPSQPTVNYFYENKGNGNLERITNSVIVADSAFFGTSNWADFDNDGDWDLFVTDGWSDRSNFLYQNNGDRTFTKIISEQVTNDGAYSLGCCWADYDKDGDMDLFVANGHVFQQEANFLYKNLTNDNPVIANNWINISCIGLASNGLSDNPMRFSNKSAIGAKVRVKAWTHGAAQEGVWQMSEISAQSGAGGQNSLNAEFGLGQATSIDSLIVEWPSKIRRILTNVNPVNRHMEIIEALAPTISHLPSSLPISEATDAMIEARIEDEADITEPFVHSRRGGDTEFVAVKMSLLSENVYQAIIPAAIVGGQGVDYYFTAKNIYGLSTRLPASGIYSLRVKINAPGVVNTEVQPAGNAQTAYRLISIPIAAENANTGVVLSDNLGEHKISRWRFFAIRPEQFNSNADYAEFPDDTLANKLEVGKAYWLIVKDGGKVIDSGPGITNQTSQEYKIALQPGWNFIGTPFNFKIPIRNVSLHGARTPPALRSFETQWNVSPVLELAPFKGYAILLESPDTLLINPNLTDTTGSIFPKLLSFREKGSQWSIGIRAQCQEARDEDNLAAVRTTASGTRDEFDQPEPPVIGEYVSIYFTHLEWNRLAKTYCIDARPEPTNGDVWDFEVKTNIRDKVNLTFTGIESVPLEFEVWLTDDALRITQNLRETNGYAVAGSENPKSLKLVVGKKDFVKEKLAQAQLIPTHYELSQNFPNPFNPVTTIRYGLPQAGRVSLKIYNLLGEEVATLADDEQKAAGYHVAIWDGTDKNDVHVTSGVYVYRIRAGGFMMTKKMALVK